MTSQTVDEMPTRDVRTRPSAVSRVLVGALLGVTWAAGFRGYMSEIVLGLATSIPFRPVVETGAISAARDPAELKAAHH